MGFLKKYLYFVITLLIIIGFGIIFFSNKLVDKEKRITVDKISTIYQKPEVVIEKKVVKIEKQIKAKILSWDSKKSELIFKIIDSEEIKKIILDSNEISIFVPEAQNKTKAVIPLFNNDENWETAFCPQDTLTVGYDGNEEIKLFFNTGYRMCGFKGE